MFVNLVVVDAVSVVSVFHRKTVPDRLWRGGRGGRTILDQTEHLRTRLPPGFNTPWALGPACSAFPPPSSFVSDSCLLLLA